jgi:hypothetical protein
VCESVGYINRGMEFEVGRGPSSYLIQLSALGQVLLHTFESQALFSIFIVPSCSFWVLMGSRIRLKLDLWIPSRAATSNDIYLFIYDTIV